jgi:hypothetical protein
MLPFGERWVSPTDEKSEQVKESIKCLEEFKKYLKERNTMSKREYNFFSKNITIKNIAKFSIAGSIVLFGLWLLFT